jgi:hypothetical protein
MPAGDPRRPEKAAHYTQRFALLQQRDTPKRDDLSGVT